MSKKIILLGAILMCTFIYGCGAQKDVDEQQVSTENLRVSDNESDVAWTKETTEIPVAKKNNWGPVEVQWRGRGGDTVEVSDVFEEDIN